MAIATSKKLNKYQRLERAVGGVARDWSGDIELDGKPGSREGYLSLAKVVLERAYTIMDDVPDDWTKDITEAAVARGRPIGASYNGLKVKSLFCHNVAFRAGYQGLQWEGLQAILRNSASFKPLGILAGLPQDTAILAEAKHGLLYRCQKNEIEFMDEDRYRIEDGAVILPELDFVVARQRLIAGLALTPKGCRASEVLEDLYSHIVKISLHDSRLAVASLKRGFAARPKPS